MMMIGDQHSSQRTLRKALYLRIFPEKISSRISWKLTTEMG